VGSNPTLSANFPCFQAGKRWHLLAPNSRVIATALRAITAAPTAFKARFIREPAATVTILVGPSPRRNAHARRSHAAIATAAWTPPEDNRLRFGAPAATCAAAFPHEADKNASCQLVRQFGPNERLGDVCKAMFADAKSLGFVLDKGRYAVDGHEGRCEFNEMSSHR
jgi:hypothetical protein